MADLADHAFTLTRTALGPGDPAHEAAIAAVRRGGRSRSAVLGHARAEALGRAASAAPADLDAAAPSDLTELAVALASTRPPLERVVVELEGRHGLDRTGFGRALGTTTADAAARAAEVAGHWQRTLDPVLLARLGPGGCEGLAAALGVGVPADEGGEDGAGGAGEAEAGVGGGPIEAAPGPVPLRELLALGPAVTDHAAGCEPCTDRLRSMVSVRALVAQRPLDEAPAVVRAAAAPSRLRRPAPPPPLEPEQARWRRLRPLALGGAALVGVLVAGGLGAAALQADGGSDDESVEALTRVPEAGNVLVAQPATVEGRTPPPVRLTNRSDAAISWVAAPDVPWLTVRPAEGTLAEGASVALRLVVTPEAPEGEVRGSVQITGRDGSATVVRLAATIERPPDVAATAEGCDVQAVVEDEGEVRAVQLHWYDPPATPGARGDERIEPMAAGAAAYLAKLPGGAVPITWWVTATDARGNGARTADAVLPPLSCSP